jgi:hypothetical protein
MDFIPKRLALRTSFVSFGTQIVMLIFGLSIHLALIMLLKAFVLLRLCDLLHIQAKYLLLLHHLIRADLLYFITEVDLI